MVEGAEVSTGQPLVGWLVGADPDSGTIRVYVSPHHYALEPGLSQVLEFGALPPGLAGLVTAFRLNPGRRKNPGRACWNCGAALTGDGEVCPACWAGQSDSNPGCGCGCNGTGACRNPLPPAPRPSGIKTICMGCGRHVSGHVLAPTVSHGYCRPCGEAILRSLGRNPDEDRRRRERSALEGDALSVERARRDYFRTRPRPAPMVHLDALSGEAYEDHGSIWLTLTHLPTGRVLFQATDEDASDLFELGFVKRDRRGDVTESLARHAEEMGFLRLHSRTRPLHNVCVCGSRPGQCRVHSDMSHRRGRRPGRRNPSDEDRRRLERHVRASGAASPREAMSLITNWLSDYGAYAAVVRPDASKYVDSRAPLILISEGGFNRELDNFEEPAYSDFVNFLWSIGWQHENVNGVHFTLFPVRA